MCTNGCFNLAWLICFSVHRWQYCNFPCNCGSLQAQFFIFVFCTSLSFVRCISVTLHTFAWLSITVEEQSTLWSWMSFLWTKFVLWLIKNKFWHLFLFYRVWLTFTKTHFGHIISAILLIIDSYLDLSILSTSVQPFHLIEIL